jgi:hypothetical protein
MSLVNLGGRPSQGIETTGTGPMFIDNATFRADKRTVAHFIVVHPEFDKRDSVILIDINGGAGF